MKKHRIMAVIFGLAILVSGTLAVKASAFGPPHHKGGCLGLRALMGFRISSLKRFIIFLCVIPFSLNHGK